MRMTDRPLAKQAQKVKRQKQLKQRLRRGQQHAGARQQRGRNHRAFPRSDGVHCFAHKRQGRGARQRGGEVERGNGGCGDVQGVADRAGDGADDGALAGGGETFGDGRRWGKGGHR